jgi:hypothetical protein
MSAKITDPDVRALIVMIRYRSRIFSGKSGCWGPRRARRMSTLAGPGDTPTSRLFRHGADMPHPPTP